MDRVHEGVHGLGTQRWSMDRGLHYIRPSQNSQQQISLLKRLQSI